jgi:hypothetical protein
MYMTIRQKRLESVQRYRGMVYSCPSIAVDATTFYYYASSVRSVVRSALAISWEAILMMELPKRHASSLYGQPVLASDLTFQKGLMWGSALWRRRRPIALA